MEYYIINLHLNNNDFEGAIVATAEYFEIPEIFIEKDYWVTYALHQLFHSEIKDLIVFKGGTSLSKCYNVIKRFSEDIDLVVVKSNDDTGNDLKRKLKAVTDVIDKSTLKVVLDDPNTNKKNYLHSHMLSDERKHLLINFFTTNSFFGNDIKKVADNPKEVIIVQEVA